MGRRTAIIDYLDVSHIRNRYNYRKELDLWKPYEETDPDEPGGAIYPHYTFTYDPIGNRLTREAMDSSGTIQKEYDANVLNQYESITNPAQAGATVRLSNFCSHHRPPFPSKPSPRVLHERSI